MDQSDIVVRQGLYLRAWTIRSIKAVRWGNVTVTRMVGVSVGVKMVHSILVESNLSSLWGIPVGHTSQGYKTDLGCRHWLENHQYI